MHSYTELLKPSVVSHACILKCASSSKNKHTDTNLLVVVRGQSLLQVYDGLESYELRWLADMDLQGTVFTMQPIGINLLCISFAAAKLVLLEWSKTSLTFQTKSLHFYEKHPTSEYLVSNISGHKMMVNLEHKIICLWIKNEGLTFTQYDSDKTGNLKSFIENLKSSENDQFSEWKSPSSMVIFLQNLIKDISVTEIVDMAWLTCYAEPTIAFLAWSLPNWAGTVGLNGKKTKVIAVYTTFNNLETLKITEVSYNAFQIFPLSGVDKRIALIIETNGIKVIDEAASIIPIEIDLDIICLADCHISQFENTQYVIILSKSGDMLIIDTNDCKLIGKKEKWTASRPNSLHVSGKYIVASCLDGNTKVAKWSLEKQSDNPSNGFKIDTNSNSNDDNCYEFLNMLDFYTSMPKPEPMRVPSINLIHELTNHGPPTAVTTISSGLACSTKSGVLVIEKELNLVELSKIILSINLKPGNFWLTSSSISSRKILINNKENHEKLHSLSFKRARRDLYNADFTNQIVNTEFDELSRDHRKPLDLPRGISTDQKTLIVFEKETSVWVVQSCSMALYEVKSWRLLKRKVVEHCDHADISSSGIVTYSSTEKVCRLYCNKQFDKLGEFKEIDLVAISDTTLAMLQCSKLIIRALKDDNLFLYDVSNLDSLLTPFNDLSISQSSNSANSPIEVAYNSIYALRFHGTDFIGIHVNRYFALYEHRGTDLLKRYTLPFAVNQSPIFLSALEILIFPGKKTHLLVKASHSNFQYHRLELFGERLIDAIPLQDKSFAWLDDKNRLHLAKIDHSLDYHSFSLPLRYFPLDVENCSIVNLGYHEESTSLIIGVNIAKVTSKGSRPDCESIDEEVLKCDEPDSHTNSDTQNIDDNNDGIELQTYSEIYGLDLRNNKFYSRPLAKVDEALLSMCIIDYDDVNSRQMLSIGTSNLAVESEETNGHLIIFKFHINSEDSSNDLKVSIFAQEQLRGPVSSMCVSMGYLVVSHGQQIRVYNIHGHSKLDARGFFQTDIYVQDLKCIRNIIGLGEQMRSPRLINFATQPHRLDQLSSADPCKMKISSVEFVSSAARGDLTLVCATLDKTLVMYQYDPENLESNGGSRLVPISNFYTGRHCTSMCAAQIYNNNDIVAYGVNSDGSLFTIRPLNEEMYRTLYLLINQLMQREAGEAGLNPKMYRLGDADAQSSKGQLLDLKFAHRFWNLSIKQQNNYGRFLGFQGLRRVQRALSVDSRDLLKL